MDFTKLSARFTPLFMFFGSCCVHSKREAPSLATRKYRERGSTPKHGIQTFQTLHPNEIGKRAAYAIICSFKRKNQWLKSKVYREKGWIMVDCPIPWISEWHEWPWVPKEALPLLSGICWQAISDPHPTIIRISSRFYPRWYPQSVWVYTPICVNIGGDCHLTI